MTNVQTQQQQAQTLKERVCQLLEWDETQYAQFQYEMGLAYLSEYISGDSVAIDQLTRSRVFWNWWKNQWAQRDEQFAKTVNDDYTLEDCIYIYLDQNNPTLLAHTTHPNAVVLYHTYAAMMGAFIDEVNQQA